MQSATLLDFAEGSLLFMVLVLAAGITLLIRRLLLQGLSQAGKGRQIGLTLLDSLLFPALALGVGYPAFHLFDHFCIQWGQACSSSPRLGWNLFWLAMLGFNFVEAIVTQLLNHGSQGRIPALLRGVLRVVVIALSAFFVLRFALGFDITPLLASTALVTAVVGFALQGVLGNLMAGMSLNLTGSLAHDDWVSIDGLEGQVEEVNWRETWLLTGEQISVRVPNSKMAESRIRHLNRPQRSRRCSVLVDASYDDPPDAVMDAMIAAALAVSDVCRQPQPVAFPAEFKDYGIGYEMFIWLDAYPNRIRIQGEVRRRIWYEFDRRGIRIPYPLSDQVINHLAQRMASSPDDAKTDPETRGRVEGLLRSDFANKVLRDTDGKLLIPENDLARWAESLTRLRYGRNETVFRQGDPGDGCYVVLSGQLEGVIHYPETGREARFPVEAGAVVGEMSLMTGLPRMAEIRVLQSAELLRIPPHEFAALLRDNPDVLGPLSRLVAERVQSNQQQYDLLQANSAQPISQVVSSEGILKRFWRLLGGSAGFPA